MSAAKLEMVLFCSGCRRWEQTRKIKVSEAAENGRPTFKFRRIKAEMERAFEEHRPNCLPRTARRHLKGKSEFYCMFASPP